MSISNFYIDADIDGRNTNLAGGPRGKDGGINIFYNQRDHGEITQAVHIRSYVDIMGMLVTEVYDRGNNIIHKVITER